MGKFYVPICVYEVCVSFCDVFLTYFCDHESLGFFKKVFFLNMYQAIYGYLAKFALPISQVYFVKLQSSPCYCDFTFLPSPLPNCKVNFATWQTPQCYLANLWIMLFKKHSAWSKLLPKIKLPLVLFLFFMGWLTGPHPFSFYLSLSLLFFFFFVVCLYGSLKLQKSRLCSFFYFFMLFKDFF